MDKASIEVRDKLESVQLPLEVKKSVLLRFNPSTEPIMRLALSGESHVEGVDEVLLKRLRRYGQVEQKGRESCGGTVVQYVECSGGGDAVKKKTKRIKEE